MQIHLCKTRIEESEREVGGSLNELYPGLCEFLLFLCPFLVFAACQQ